MEHKRKKDKDVQQNQESITRPLLWDVAITKVKAKEEKLDENEHLETDRSLLIAGARESGKTSIILSFTDRVNELAKPTIALDYTFCRKGRANSSTDLFNFNKIKDVGNIWELGEGIFLTKLIDVVINPNNITSTSAIVTINLARLQELWTTLETFIKCLRQRINECIKQACASNSILKEKIKQSTAQRIGDNPDKSKIEPFEIPVAIVATKYDVFESYEPEQRKIIVKCLRFVAHYYGAMLVFSSFKNEITINKVKALINNFLFDGPLNKQMQLEHLKPVFVPFGMDSFESIGNPPLAASDLNNPNNKEPVDLWRTVFCKHFPQEEIKRDSSLLTDHGNDPQFAEPLIDTLREQKSKELDNLRELLNKNRKQNNEYGNIQIIS